LPRRSSNATWPEVAARVQPARHELPAIDEAALAAARGADRLLDCARERGIERWASFLAPVPDQLRDAGVGELRAVAQRARAAYGSKDSIRELLPADLTEPFLADIDRLRKALTRVPAER
jgi:hypothetical protein